MDANCPVVEALKVAEHLFPNQPLEVLVSLGAGSVGPAPDAEGASSSSSSSSEAAAAATAAAKRAEVEGRGAEWIAHLVSLQMEGNRIWSMTKAHQADDVKAAMCRLNPPEVSTHTRLLE